MATVTMPEVDKFGEGLRARMIAETLLVIAAKTNCDLSRENAEQIATSIVAEEFKVRVAKGKRAATQPVQNLPGAQPAQQPSTEKSAGGGGTDGAQATCSGK